MIVRILRQGQFDVPDMALDTLNELDEALVTAIESGDDDTFTRALAELLAGVRTAATRSTARISSCWATTASSRVELVARTRFPVDRGLASRMVATMFLLGLLYVVFVAVIIAIGTSAVLALALAGGLLIVQYFASDRIALAAMGAKVVNREQEPELHAVVDRLCAMADMPKPRVAVADADMPNAFATGQPRSLGRVCDHGDAAAAGRAGAGGRARARAVPCGAPRRRGDDDRQLPGAGRRPGGALRLLRRPVRRYELPTTSRARRWSW